MNTLINTSYSSLHKEPFFISDAFITTWKTTTPNETIIIGLDGALTYNFTVDWGDNSQETITSGNDLSHTYSNPGNYLVKINGTFPRIFMDRTPATPDKLISINNWGNIQWQSMVGAFKDCSYLISSSAEIPPILTNVDKILNIFFSAGTDSNLLFNYINQWDVSNVTDMGSAFRNSTFNQSLTNWDTSNVSQMQWMFGDAEFFNGDISSWDVSNVTTMLNMFRRASAFNQDISSWDVGSVTNMNYMFGNAVSFNQNIGSWDVSNVTTMMRMLNIDTSLGQLGNFDQDISNWDILKVSNLIDFLRNQKLSTTNYDKLLIGWEATLQATYPNGSGYPYLGGGVTASFGNSEYTGSSAASAARLSLDNNYNWTITDGGTA